MYSNKKNLILVRGCPGSGKTTLAETLAHPLGAPVYSADQYFETIDEKGETVYKFDAKKLGAAHAQCQKKVNAAMVAEFAHIFVANTFTRENEMKEYYDLAKEHGYRVFSIVVENKHGGKDVHNVPEETLKAMKARFQIIL